jgi:hypothetical protein
MRCTCVSHDIAYKLLAILNESEPAGAAQQKKDGE